MIRQLGVIMDPIADIQIQVDTTFAMLLEAQRRGWPIHYMEPKDLFLRDGKVFARMRLLQVTPELPGYQFLDETVQELAQLDIVLMRKDPPVTMEYIYVTQLLDLAERAGVLVANKPQSLRDYNEKLFISQFPQCCAPTLVTAHARQVHEFLTEHQDIICKPLHGRGGQEIFRIQQRDPNINVIIETLTQYGTRYLQAQKFIPEITSHGDKRIILINGEPIPYALARFPAAGETRANLHLGGEGVGIALSDRDRWICEQIGSTLREKGLYFVGIDVIGDYLTEINVTSPTGVRQLDAQFGLNICAKFLDCF